MSKSHSYYDEPFTVTLPREHWFALLYAARHLRKKRKREIANSTPFVPEPGRRNSQKEQIRKLTESIRLIEAAIEAEQENETHAQAHSDRP